MEVLKRDEFTLFVSSSRFSSVASLAHPEEMFKKTKGHRKLSGFAVFVSSLRF